ADAIKPEWACRGVGPRVEALERWTDALASVSASPNDSRLMFVFDTDYGEVSTAMYMVLGQSLVASTTLLMPPRLFVNNGELLPGRTFLYRALEDIVDAVDRHRPDLVFICSGYLFPVHKICTSEQLGELIDLLSARG